MAEYIYIDNSNVFIEGKRIEAKKGKLKRGSDSNYRLDFGELYDFVAESDPKKIPVRYFWDRVRRRATRFG